MNNKQRSDYYFNQAEEEYKLISYYLAKENWNMVIRKSQEVVELLLKGVLKYMNIEFPKEHDIGEYFEKILIQRKIKFDKQAMNKIKIASKDLTSKRAPAYYGEEFYSKEEAFEAKGYADFTKKFIQKLMIQLKGTKKKNKI